MIKSLTPDEERRYRHVLEAIGEDAPQTPPADNTWENCVDLIWSLSTRQSRDQALPHIHYTIPTSMSSEAEKKHRRQVRLFLFFQSLNVPGLNLKKPGEIYGSGIRQAHNRSIQSTLSINKNAKNQIIQFIKEREALRFLVGAAAHDFKAIFKDRRIVFRESAAAATAKDGKARLDKAWADTVAFLARYGVTPPTLPYRFTAPSLIDAITGSNVGQQRATALANQFLAPSQQQATTMANQFLAPILLSLGLTLKDGLAQVMRIAPDLSARLATEVTKALPGIAHLAALPDLAQKGKAFYDSYMAKEDTAKQIQYMDLYSVYNKAAFDKLKTFLEDDVRGAAVDLAFSATKAALLTIDMAAPGAGTTAALGATAVESISKVLILIGAVLMDVHYLNRGNEILDRFKAGGDVTAAELFAAAPILCCFYITTASTSTLIATKIFNRSEHGKYISSYEQNKSFQDDVHADAQNASALKATAGAYIEKSRLRLDPKIETGRHTQSFWGALRFMLTGKTF